MSFSSSSSESQTSEISPQMMSFHDHPLLTSDSLTWCNLCENPREEIGYECLECDFKIHKDCYEVFISHPSPCNHPLKFFLPPDDVTCHFCRYSGRSLFASCTTCNIVIDRYCIPPFTILKPKHHKHSLTLLPRRDTFTCDACGLKGDRDPYVCCRCSLMIHQDCLDLPRVININRHDHRITHTFKLGRREDGGHWECGVCRKTIDENHGAFKCSLCPTYAVHSKCATRKEVWDGKELEDVPEVEEIIEASFKVVNENGDIVHFSHKNHILRRMDENSVTDIRCHCCLFSITGDPWYKCVECDFVLHEACANLPRKTRVLVHNHKVFLQVDGMAVFGCRPCGRVSSGYRYVCLEEVCKDDEDKDEDELEERFDVRCSSLSEPFQHDLHPQHPLYYTLEGFKMCKACGEETENPYTCIVSDCDYVLCRVCATLPRKVTSRYDDHFLRLSQGVGNASGYLWCDICEKETDPSKRYYTCDDCGVALHIDCVLGDFAYSNVGLVYTFPAGDGDSAHHVTFEVLSNNGATRPLCNGCESRCRFPFVLRIGNLSSGFEYFCTISCSPDFV